MKSLTLVQPKAGNLPKAKDYLWRYYDIHKFLNLLQNQKFRFSRMDKFEDPLEGIPLNAIVTHRTKLDLNLIQNVSLSELILDEKLRERIPPLLQSKLRSINAIQKTTFVTCWFAEQQESLAMWNLYSNPDGVAIKIPFGQLTKKLKIDTEVSSFYGGMVVYQNFDNDSFSPKSDSASEVRKVALRKHRSFKHECEFRIVARLRDHHNELSAIDSKPLDLSSLQMKVICHPRMAAWKKENVKNLLSGFGLTNAVENSVIRLR